MQKLEQAAVVFCTACICAELAVQLVGHGWAHRCIKAAAGLYILVVLSRMLSVVTFELRTFSFPQAVSVSLGTWEDAVADRTTVQLEQTLAQQWQSETGSTMMLHITLSTEKTDLVPILAKAELPSTVTEEQSRAASTFLQNALELSASQVEIVRSAGEATS